VIDSPNRGDAILDLAVTSASKLIIDVKTGNTVSCSNHALVEFTVLRDMGKARSVVKTLNFRKANFQLFKELVSRTSGELVLRDTGQNRAGRCIKRRSSEVPCVRSQERKGRHWHGLFETC